MKAQQNSVSGATYRVALGTVPPFEKGDTAILIDLAIADKTFTDSEGNAVEYGKLFFTFSNGATLSGSVFRGVHHTGTRKSDTAIIHSKLATAMAKSKVVASREFPRPKKGEPDPNAKAYNELAILTLLRELSGNSELQPNENVTEINFSVTAVYNCIGVKDGTDYQYTAYELDLPEPAK